MNSSLSCNDINLFLFDRVNQKARNHKVVMFTASVVWCYPTTTGAIFFYRASNRISGRVNFAMLSSELNCQHHIQTKSHHLIVYRGKDGRIIGSQIIEEESDWKQWYINIEMFYGWNSISIIETSHRGANWLHSRAIGASQQLAITESESLVQMERKLSVLRLWCGWFTDAFRVYLMNHSPNSVRISAGRRLSLKWFQQDADNKFRPECCLLPSSTWRHGRIMDLYREATRPSSDRFVMG